MSELKIRCYSRLVDSDKDDSDGKIKGNSTIENLDASIQAILQNWVADNADYVPIATRVVSSVYLANFYLTVLQDYKKASALCDKVVNFPGRWADRIFYERLFPIFIRNELSSIFDEHFRTVLGLITLHRSIVDSLRDKSTVLVRIRPAKFT